MSNLVRFAAPILAGFLALASASPVLAGMGDRPGDFDYYALVLSWSPSFCLSGGGSHSGDPQCGTSRPYAFVLHGLWPQFDVRWPEDCDVGNDPTTVPDNLAQSMLDIMPSDKLVQHEYAKHGTCSGLDMGAYFLMARRLFTSINVPPKYVNLTSEIQEPLDGLRSDLLAANPQFKPGMIAVDCDKHGRLVEIHFCYSKTGEPQNCGRNEIQAKMCRQDTISMPPVRGHVAGASTASVPSAEPSPSPAPAASAAADATKPSSANDTTQADATDPNAVNDTTPDDGTGYTRHRHRHRHKHRLDYFND